MIVFGTFTGESGVPESLVIIMASGGVATLILLLILVIVCVCCCCRIRSEYLLSVINYYSYFTLSEQIYSLSEPAVKIELNINKSAAMKLHIE